MSDVHVSQMWPRTHPRVEEVWVDGRCTVASSMEATATYLFGIDEWMFHLHVGVCSYLQFGAIVYENVNIIKIITRSCLELNVCNNLLEFEF